MIILGVPMWSRIIPVSSQDPLTNHICKISFTLWVTSHSFWGLGQGHLGGGVLLGLLQGPTNFLGGMKEYPGVIRCIFFKHR